MNNQNQLPPEIVAEIERLGGRFSPAQNGKEKFINNHPVPEPVRQFLYDVEWSRELSYYSDEDSDLWVWLTRFGLAQWLDAEEFAVEDRGERPLVWWGEADGGNYLLLIDLDDPNPANPSVYKIDHYDPEQRLYSTVNLLDFLRSLKIEGEETDDDDESFEI